MIRYKAGFLLEKLVKENIFVTALEDGQSYCYHQMMRDYLLKRFREKKGKKGVCEYHKLAPSLLERVELAT